MTMIKDRSGNRLDKPSSQDRMLSALYGSVWGRMLLRLLVCPCVSRMAGRFLSSRLSTGLIQP